MKKILSGIQPSGNPHIGNYFGAIKQLIELQENNQSFIFIADLHALTTVKDPKQLKENILKLAATYLSLGLSPDKVIFYKQSDISEHAELCWILDCLTPLPLLKRAHAFKDAQNKNKKEITAGLFNYPILMAADILLYKPDLVPVGKDQKQHIEISRDLAEKFNHTYGETFPLPEAFIKEETETLPGTDGQKMSKSYQNTIDIFATPKILKKQVMGIVTDSKELDEAKDPKTCNIFQIYKHFANEEEKSAMEKKYKAGGYGYGHAKKELLEKITNYFSKARKEYDSLLENKEKIEKILSDGAEKAKKVAVKTLDEVKTKIGVK